MVGASVGANEGPAEGPSLSGTVDRKRSSGRSMFESSTEHLQKDKNFTHVESLWR